MKWKKVAIDTITAAVDVIGSRLVDLGVSGFEVIDKVPLTEQETKGMFIDILPDLGPDDGRATVVFYLEEGPDETRMLDAVRGMLRDVRAEQEIGSGTLTITQTENEDWENNWKQYFKSFSVGNILIHPSWEDVPEETEGMIPLAIDPGTAFGTGSHETTRLCIRALEKLITGGEKVLDIGCGSGILSIAALLLGAGSALGTDLDEAAIEASEENARRNGIDEERFTVIQGNILDNPRVQQAVGGGYDILAANILAPVILELTKQAADYLKPGGYFVSSGIIDTKAPEVEAALKANPAFELVASDQDGEWFSFTARRV